VPDDLSAFGDVGPDRRAFLKRLIIGTAFVVPVVSTFTMSGVGSVFATAPRSTTLATNTNTTDTTTTTTATTATPATPAAIPTTPTTTTNPKAPQSAVAPAAVHTNPNFTG
jgi:hypothetical protein